MNGLSPPMRKLVAWSIVLVMALAFVVYGILPVYNARRVLDEELAHKVDLIKRHEGRLAHAEIVLAGGDTAIESFLESGLFLRENESRLAEAELREYLNASVAGTGAKIQSSQGIGQGTSNGPVGAVSLQVTIEATLSQLQDILYNIEAQAPYLFIRQLQIHGGRRAGGQREAPLRVQLRITGYAHPGGER